MSSRVRLVGALTAALLTVPLLIPGAALGASGVQARPKAPSQAAVERAQRQARDARSQVAALQTRVTSAQNNLVSLNGKLAQASEQYNGAVYQQQQAQKAADAATATATTAEQDMFAAQTDLSRFASAAYRSGGDLGAVDALLSAQGPQQLLDQSATVTVLGQRQSALLSRMVNARITAVAAQQQAQQALDAKAAATAQVKAAKDKAQSLVDAAQAQANSLRRAQVQLQRRVNALASRADRLAAQRAAALAAQEAAKRAEQDGGDGVDLGIPRGILLGMPVVAPTGQQRGDEKGAQRAIAYARAQLGKPYVWAAAGPDTFDCSGLTMMAWRAGGVSLSHWSIAQYAEGRKIPLGQIRPGDLVFFSTDLTEYRAIHHVGLYIGGGQMIEAPYTGAVVRISTISRPSLYGAVRP